MKFLDERFQGPSKKGEGDCRVRVMGGGVGGWIDSRSYMLGYGERFLGPCIGWTENCKYKVGGENCRIYIQVDLG